MSLSFSYPIWFLLLCVALGIVYAGILYYKDKSYNEVQGKQRWFLPLMTFMRWAGATLISALLLSPFLKTIKNEEQKPYIIIAQDKTQSVKNALSGEDSTKLKNSLQNIASALGDQYKVETYSFDNQLTENFDFTYPGKSTNLSATYSELYNRYNNQNVGAIIMATDGIYNEGSNPLYQTDQLPVPLYAIALGDTTPRKDLKLDKVLHNDIVYLDDKFSIRIDVSAYNCVGGNSVLNVYKGKTTENKIASKNINIDKNSFSKSEDIVIDANVKGVQAYTILLSPISGELTTQNNTKTIYIEVLEGRQKVLLLADSPNPDIAALRKSIDLGKNYQTEAKVIDEFAGNISVYDVVILHGLPSITHNCESLISQAEKNNVSLLYIMSSSTSINALSQKQDILNISNPGNTFNDVKPLINNSFNLFTVSDEIKQVVAQLPPLKSRYADYSVGTNNETLLFQKIGQVSTTYPLLSFRKTPTNKIAILSAEGLWLWRMYDFMKFQTFEHVDELIAKTIQYLSVKEDKRKFKAASVATLYNENESVSFTAELYNDSYELINEPDVAISIKDSEDKEYPYIFNRTANAYELKIGKMPVSEYSYTAKCTYGGKELLSSGNFTIKELQLETTQTTADHNLLLNLAKKSGGELLSLSNMDSLISKLKSRTDIKPVIYSSIENNSVINLKWIFFVLLFLLSLEWFLRKFLGGL